MSSSPHLRVEGVSKTYGDVKALDSVSLEFQKGEIHAVLGENGAGKSTLMGVLAGFVHPDSGRVILDGSSLDLGRPHETKDAGIEMVHQHFMLVQEFTVLENLALARFGSLSGLHDLDSVEADVSETAKSLGWEVDFSAKVRDLPVGTQQRVEILKALGSDADLLIFDEPTAVLSPEEAEDLFQVLRTLRDEGKCVILIAHKLSEVLSVADRVSVLRAGKFVATALRAEIDETVLAQWMVGELPEPSAPLTRTVSEPLLDVVNVRVRGTRGEEAVRGVSFSVSSGEIFGIGGVDGNGQPELAEALAGVRHLSGGELRWHRQGCKVGFVPQDRQGQGLALGMSVTDNLLIVGHRRSDLAFGPFLRPSAVRSYARGLIDEYDVRTGSIGDVVGSLSGGNQQKIVVSRTFAEKPGLLIVHNPTRGLDIRATAFVRSQILDAARNGAAVVLLSADHDELAKLATRISYMSRGVLTEGGAEAVVGGPS